MWSTSRTTSDASHAVGANLSRTQHQQEAPTTQDLAVAVLVNRTNPPKLCVCLPYDMRRPMFDHIEFSVSHQRSSRKLGPVVKMDRVKKVTIQNEETKNHSREFKAKVALEAIREEMS